MKKVFLVFITLMMFYSLDYGEFLSQINIIDSEFKIGARSFRKFYYNFANGDTLVLKAEVIKGNNISGLRIFSWPDATLFSSYAAKIITKKLYIPKKTTIGIEVKNTSIFGNKVYKISISRIPQNKNSINFNTQVKWDTTYDTTYVPVVESTLVEQDTIPKKVLNSNLTLNKKYVLSFTIPKGTISWGYWIGVGHEAVRGLSNMVSLLPKASLTKGITDPVTAYALGYINGLYETDKGASITYYFVEGYKNVEKFNNGEGFYQFKENTCITDYSIMNTHLNGYYYICLYNPNSLPQYVTVKIVAITVHNKWDVKNVNKMKLIQRITPGYY